MHLAGKDNSNSFTAAGEMSFLLLTLASQIAHQKNLKTGLIVFRSHKGMICLHRVTVIFSSFTVRLFVILRSIKSISVNTKLLGVPHQPEVCYPGCLGTDCDWVRPISILIESTVSKISFLSSGLYAKGEQDLETDLFFNTWLLCFLINLTQLTVKFLKNSSQKSASYFCQNSLLRKAGSKLEWLNLGIIPNFSVFSPVNGYISSVFFRGIFWFSSFFPGEYDWSSKVTFVVCVEKSHPSTPSNFCFLYLLSFLVDSIERHFK